MIYGAAQIPLDSIKLGTSADVHYDVPKYSANDFFANVGRIKGNVLRPLPPYIQSKTVFALTFYQNAIGPDVGLCWEHPDPKLVPVPKVDTPEVAQLRRLIHKYPGVVREEMVNHG